MDRVTIWTSDANGGGEWQSSVTATPTSLPPDTLPPDTLPPDTLPPDTLPPDTLPPDTTVPPDTTAGDGRPVLVPARAGRAIAALVVPEHVPEHASAAGAVTLDRVPLPAGIHLVHHGDRVGVGATELWVSAVHAPDATRYDPQHHGADRFCARARSRIEPGAEIVVCPGTHDAPCGLIYTRAAWKIVSTCAQCKFDPAAPTWRPPSSAAGRSIDALLERAARRRIGDADA